MSPLSGDVEIGLILPRSPLGHEARGKRGAARPVYLVESNLGKCFLKLADGKSGIIDDVDRDLALRLCRLKGFVPLALPRLRRSAGARNVEKQGDSQTKKDYSFCIHSNYYVRHQRWQISFTIKAEREAKNFGLGGSNRSSRSTASLRSNRLRTFRNRGCAASKAFV